MIEFNKEFYDFFNIIAGEINPRVNENTDVNVEDYAIYIDPEDIVKVEEQDYDSLYNTCIHNGHFYIRNIKNPEEPDIVIQSEGEKEMFLSEEASALMKKGKGLIYFKDLDDDMKIFEMVILNQELTKPLYELIKSVSVYCKIYEKYFLNCWELLIRQSAANEIRFNDYRKHNKVSRVQLMEMGSSWK